MTGDKQHRFLPMPNRSITIISGFMRPFISGSQRTGTSEPVIALMHFRKSSIITDVDSVPAKMTSHYKYSTDHGFDPTKYTMSGLSIEVLLDSRDNSIRPTKGYLANIAFRPNFTFLGSSKNSLMLNTEFRTYISLSKRRPDHLIGFWYLGQFNQAGSVPYLGLPALCWDMYNRAGRGYIQGSIRGVNFIYGESEYRFPISPYSGILSGVAFVNVTTASSDDGERKLFEYFDPAAGCWFKDHVQQENAFQPLH